MTTTSTRPPTVTVSEIMDYEDGALTSAEAVDLFSRLVSTGMAWSLQGSYGRTAASLIEQGVLSDSGEILVDVDDL